MLPGQVTESALHAVANDSVAHRLADHEPDPRRRAARVDTGRGGEVDDEGPRPRSPSPADRGAKGVGVPQPRSRGQHGASGWLAGGQASDGQALAALAAPRGEDAATRPGAHPEAEAVDLVTATVVRLVRTLAHEYLSMVGQGQPRRRIGSASFGWHRPPTDIVLFPWTCGTGRHRVTEQRYALALHRVKPAGTAWEGPPSAPVDDVLLRWRRRGYVRAHRGSPSPPPPGGAAVE